ncbi:uncharacterized protein LOC121426725 [Lytechinus variegatus]|uniref:uncharacterized protein LOC121426725 n=1 Tax=Lytechinus variegatus TaxID=7654 RepID=UPI001BB2C43C|nr:uncharacterized protein LOC121426725 [Lytechinus variegatus]
MAILTTYCFTPSSAFSYEESDDKGSTTRNETNDIPPVYQAEGIFSYADEPPTSQSFVLNGKLFCYKCGAYQNTDGDDFDSTLDDCMFRAAETAFSEECPNRIMNMTSYGPACYVNKMMAAGHITSFSRGCMVHYDCQNMDYCESTVNRTGACQSCCREDYCNRAAGECLPRVEVFKLLALTLFSYLLFVR